MNWLIFFTYCLWFGHNWELDRDMAVLTVYECRECGKRVRK